MIKKYWPRGWDRVEKSPTRVEEEPRPTYLTLGGRRGADLRKSLKSFTGKTELNRNEN